METEVPETFTVKRATNKVRASHDGHAYHKAWAARSALKFRRKHGDSCVERVMRYDFETNRPINPNLLAAITALRSGAAAVDDVARQAEQISTSISGGIASPSGRRRWWRWKTRSTIPIPQPPNKGQVKVE